MPVGKIANLSVGVSLEAAEFVNGLSKTEAQAKAWNDRLVKGAGAAGLAIGAGLAAGVATFIASLNQAADAMDAFNDLKDATGASIENISALDSVARRTGTTFESVEGILVKFNKALGDARDNNGAGDALKALGLNAEELKRIDPAEALRQTAVALSQFADDGNKARIVQELFGKSVKEAAPFLKDLAEQGSLVAKTTTAQAQAAEDYNKALFEFKAATTDAARGLTAQLIPAITRTIQELNDGREAYGGFLSSFADQATVNPFKNVTENISAVREKIKEASADLAEMRSRSSNTSMGGALIARETAALERQLELYRAREKFLLKQQERDLPQADYSNEGRAFASAPALAQAPDLKKIEDARVAKKKADDEAAAAQRKYASESQAAIERAQEGARKYIDNLHKQRVKINELTAEEHVLDGILKGRVKFQDAAQAGRAFGIAQEIDQVKALTAAYEEKMARIKEDASYERDLADQRIQWAEATRTPVEKYAAQVDYLNRLFEEGKKDPEVYARSLKLVKKEFDDQVKAAKEAGDAFSEYTKQAERNIQDALGDTLEDVLTGNFDSIGKKWAALLTKMAAQAAAARLNDAMFGEQGFAKDWAATLGRWLGGGTDPSTAAGNAELFQEFGTTTLSVPDAMAKGSAGYKRVAAMADSYQPAEAANSMVFDFSGQTLNFGEGLSRGEAKAMVEQGNAKTEANIRRSMQQARRS